MLNNLAGLLDVGVPASTTSYESIATLSGTGSSTTISFTSIPSTYKHLQVRGIVRESSGAGSNDTFLGLRFDNDTAANYALHYLGGTGAVPDPNGTGGWSWGYSGLATQNNATASTMGALVLDVLDYADTNKFKTARALAGDDRNGNGYVALISTLWRSTSAIDRLDIYSKDGQNLSTTTTFALYGIKG